MIRTCIGCRLTTTATELLRIVAGPEGQPQAVIPDPRRRTAGRGAWLHPELECVALAERRRAFGRALRMSGPADPTPVREYVRDYQQALAAVSNGASNTARPA